MSNYTAVDRCRISGSKTLVPILDLGEQALTGVFPRSPIERVTTVRCGWCGARSPACCSSPTRTTWAKCMARITAIDPA